MRTCATGEKSKITFHEEAMFEMCKRYTIMDDNVCTVIKRFEDTLFKSGLDTQERFCCYFLLSASTDSKLIEV